MYQHTLKQTPTMKKSIILSLTVFIANISFCQKIETVYLDKNDSTTNMYIAVIPQNGQANSLLFLLDGFGNSPQSVLTQTDLPKYAAQQGILTIIPLLKTGSQYFGSDAASQQSLKEMIELVMVKYQLNGKDFYIGGFSIGGTCAVKYQLNGKDFYIGGFSIGGTCAVKYAELAVQKNYSVKPKAIFCS